MSAHQQKTVLLVEDSKLQRLANERTLLRAGYAVLNAGTGEEALQLAHKHDPDVIVLDMLLPGMGGQHTLRALKDDPSTMHIPVMVLSSLSQSNSSKLQAEGAANYFEKSRMFDNKAGEKEFIEILREVSREVQVKN